MAKDPQMKWIRGGAFASLALAAGFALFRRWKTARLFAAFAAAFAEKWREIRLAKDVQELLAKAGREA
ncbi:MAG TPA: hypothetical protein VJ385_15090 [Fibrobacteria bacterium]|nr:hypothetical protein [Fibrobacteria bacterium]